MAADTLKSTSITNLDAVPVVQNSTGEGAPGYSRAISDSAAPTAAGLAAIGSAYKLVRIPSNVKLKSINIVTDAALDTNAAPTLAAKVGAFYSDGTQDGTQPALQGTAVNTGADFAASGTKFGSATAATLNVDGLGALTLPNRNKPLWAALGLASDPGGFFDIVLTLTAVAATAAAGGNVGVVVQYVD
jgi:hypothetical protein